eukprot:COSAG01_NODE_188_length_22632_cov_15.284915_2_plen_81_part_00
MVRGVRVAAVAVRELLPGFADGGQHTTHNTPDATIYRSNFFRWEPAPILVCVEDPTEDLDYVSKNVRVRLGYRTRYIFPS